MLQNEFGVKAVYPTSEDGPEVAKVIDNENLRRQLEKRGDEIRVVTGHFPLATVDLLPGEWRTFTVLREPVARTLSFLRHQQKVDPARAEQTFAEIYSDPVLFDGLVHNHMVKMLSLEADEMPAAGVLAHRAMDHERLVTAKERLFQIDVVGLQEEFPAFLSRLNGVFGWTLGPELRTNTTSEVPVDDEFRARVRADNALDVELYRFANEAFGIT